ncbi:Dyp-type peroxidase [Rhodococcus triatomae]|uniref:Dye decolorizing peroxidase n=1 Tax=Rhodococcus triatomae TaxID=300028 RepID=A0A1G8AWX8_9NOCA|nr:Dyp-type peroxidase [Rhodococcus triatomae]QNG17648.1 Dyp-type peroxidase [Rhodococcus triatomae]QNG22685.1 Dyp-type peroxidase [Rhodococcus triatomae]SDH25522.1 dye decolorizing peroxidase [Rhodococcus triatomae]
MGTDGVPARTGFSRRTILGGGAVALGAAGLGWGTATATNHGTDGPAGSQTEPFHGIHQAGIATAPQAYAAFVGLDLAEGADRERVTGIMKVWTEDAVRLTRGSPALTDTEPELARLPARLTVTVGFGPGVFDAVGRRDRAPEWLRPLPAYPTIDRLDPAWGQTDLLVQICSDDPVTVAHALRELVKNVRTLVHVRWVQRGFRRARGTENPGHTMRNLMGQVDGTENLRPDGDFDRLVWDDGAAHPWLAGGTSLVLRRIRMELDTWDELDRPGRELTMGRNLANGAPLTGTDEFDTPDLTARDQFGIPVIPPGSHVARSRFTHEGERFFRRAYNYDDAPTGPSTPGELSNSGLIFAAFQRDIDSQYLPVQQRLADHDALNEWTTPIGSAVYAIPPGVAEGDYAAGDYLGRTLLEN